MKHYLPAFLVPTLILLVLVSCSGQSPMEATESPDTAGLSSPPTLPPLPTTLAPTTSSPPTAAPPSPAVAPITTPLPTETPVEPTATSFPASTPLPTETPVEPTATSFPASTPKPTETPSIRPGTYAVGQDIDPGTYVGIAGTGVLDTCYWARLQGVSGALDDILANDNAMGQFYIEVLEGDGYLETRCQITSLAAWPEPSELPESLQPGTYMVGRDIAAGTYRGEAGEEVLDTCYWARLQGVSGALDDILANDNAMGQFYIEVLEGDGYLETRCQITQAR